MNTDCLSPATPSTNIQRPEILAPAGNWECVKAAVENGADAIYFGLERFNARMRAENFTLADLPELMEFLHRRGVKGYVTLNTLIFPQELREAEQYIRSIIAAGVDAAIVQDVGICRLIRHLSPDFPIHASTQMTITSDVGVEFAEDLGCNLVVLARECSLQDINKIQSMMAYRGACLPLEVFVHGALCVAYSGQCLTSEALGGRSANRGECAQACRMPYELISDGEVVNLGERKYLLSPQDLAGLEVLPNLVQAGVSCLKIEGRLKSPEYVANVTKVYRQALDGVMEELSSREQGAEGAGGAGGAEGAEGAGGAEEKIVNASVHQSSQTSSTHSSEKRYKLEMAFSRGLYTGWFQGINNQELVHARFGKKRGVYLGEVIRVRNQQVTVKLQAPVKPGDGVVFDCGHPEDKEEGGRIYTVKQQGQEAMLTFGKGNIKWRRIHTGDRLWKTSDPELDKQLRQSFAGESPQFQRPITVEVHGEIHLPLIARVCDQLGHITQVESRMPLVPANTKPLTKELLQTQLGRLGNTPFYLKKLSVRLQGEVMLPVSELNRMRREIVTRLEQLRSQPQSWQLNPHASLSDLLSIPNPRGTYLHEKPHSRNHDNHYKHNILSKDRPKKNENIAIGIPKFHPLSEHSPTSPTPGSPHLIVLVRNLNQLQAALQIGIDTIYCEFEDPRKYGQAVEMVRQKEERSGGVKEWGSVSPARIFVAPPRITKPSENWILKQVHNCQADGYLVRNYDHLKFFADEYCIGDFSLNVANALTADYFINHCGLTRLTASYDLNISQLEDLLQSCPPEWLEVTIHQHMPMFHMEHCVFCAFLSPGTDFTNCGRPCEQHEVKIRESRIGTEHILQADAGCRNTVFNGKAQTGAEYVQHLLKLGLQHFRIEFVNESPQQVTQVISHYQKLLQGDITGSQLWQELKLQNQLGVTRGSMGRSTAAIY